MRDLADVVVNVWWWRIIFAHMALDFLAHAFPFVLFGFTSAQLVDALAIFVYSLYLLLVLLYVCTNSKSK